MEVNTQILSDLIVFDKYAKYKPEEQTREVFDEIVDRNIAMHVEKYPQLKEEIESVYNNFVRTKKVLPSMRSMQFAGKPIAVNPSRVFNCAYHPIDSVDSFSETMFLLLGGSGVGYSVQQHHIEKLPEIIGPNEQGRRFLVPDNIEGWADAIKVLIEAYTKHKRYIRFDFSDIRPKGSRLVTTGGKAPGPEPLERCLVAIRYILEGAKGRQLKSLECHDILCHIADAVLAGGIRRSAMISLFSADDEDMLTCKSGNWYETNIQRARANNSAVLVRHRLDQTTFKAVMKKTELSMAGEPGIYLTNDKDWGTNPCCEIALRPFQFCNLTEINASTIVDQDDLEKRAAAASFIGTLQAGYTDFHYLRPIWQRNTEKDALLGVSMTGIASGATDDLDLKKAAEIVNKTNEVYAKKIGINVAARTTCVKPAGTTSLVLGTSSGIHAWHNDYYLRRFKLMKDSALYTYLLINHPELIEDSTYNSKEAYACIPIKAPEGAVTRNESPMNLLRRIKRFSDDWIKPGHRTGNNTHNVSATVNLKKVYEQDEDGQAVLTQNEWPEAVEWMWENRDCYNGLSMFPFDSGTYVQAPHEDISKEEYEKRSAGLHGLDLKKVVELEDGTNLNDQAACAGAACEIV